MDLGFVLDVGQSGHVCYLLYHLTKIILQNTLLMIYQGHSSTAFDRAIQTGPRFRAHGPLRQPHNNSSIYAIHTVHDSLVVLADLVCRFDDQFGHVGLPMERVAAYGFWWQIYEGHVCCDYQWTCAGTGGWRGI